MERSLLAILLVLVVVAFGVAQDLAEQRNNHAVLKRQVRLQHIDVVLFLFLRLFGVILVLLLGSDFALQAFCVP